MCVVSCFGLVAWAQQASPATVTFTFDFPGSNPSHYVISVSADGHGNYTSNGKLASEAAPRQNSTSDADSDSEPESEAGTNEPFQENFTLSSATRARVFDLAKNAHYFEGDIELKKKNLAFTGNKTLTFKDGQKSTQATYNYSSLPAVEELTAMFQGLSATMEFVHRLEYDLHYEKLALDEELKKMEEAASEGGVSELAAAAPVLQKILNDQSIINVSRARAQRLLARAGTAGK